ncbi:MAG: hypothetical protein JOY64_03650 [Alphaproteobacteria bacterium]|nr:hypothetical protein [Alphaproteobacteria bacterium]MBV8406700.1 hypothetical protein [Alphaproteobacteria bacterium]
MTFRHEFVEALTLLATAIDRLKARGYSPPILVGGAAVELYTGGQVTSGDFDFVSADQAEFLSELERVGFERPKRAGWLTRSLWHPRLRFAVQVVSGALMDGNADAARIRIVEVSADQEESDLTLRVIPIEDLIADRMAQALATNVIREDMQNQAVRLYQLAEGLDSDYLDRRIRTETGGEGSLQILSDWAKSCAP